MNIRVGLDGGFVFIPTFYSKTIFQILIQSNFLNDFFIKTK